MCPSSNIRNAVHNAQMNVYPSRSTSTSTSKQGNPYPNVTPIVSHNEYPTVPQNGMLNNASSSSSGTSTITVPASWRGMAVPLISDELPEVSPDFREPPAFIISSLLHAFHHIAAESIFFLDYARFCDCAMLQLPIGHHARPLPALLTVVYLWGAIKCGTEYDSFQSIFLNQTIHYMAQGLESDHPFRVIHSIQACILLSHYLFCVDRVEEGRNYLQSVIDLCFDLGLHLTPAWPSNNPHPIYSDSTEQERTVAFWATFILNNVWSAGLGFPSYFSFHNASRQILRPWPSEGDSPTQLNNIQPGLAAFPIQHPPQLVIVRYLQGHYDNAHSPLALLVKASVLYERATHLFAHSPKVDAHVRHTTTAAFLAMDRLIADLHDRLTSQGDVYKIDNSITGTTHALTFGAAIQLHWKFTYVSPRSRQVCFFAAKDILERPPSSNLRLSPLCAIPWRLACEIMGREVTFIQQGIPPLYMPNSSTPVTISIATNYLKAGVQALHKYKHCPLLVHQLAIMKIPSFLV